MDETKMDETKNEPFADREMEFVHFNTTNDCDKFIHFVTQKNIIISHKCCSGSGCGIAKIKKEQLNILMKEYMRLDSNNTVRDD